MDEDVAAVLRLGERIIAAGQKALAGDTTDLERIWREMCPGPAS